MAHVAVLALFEVAGKTPDEVDAVVADMVAATEQEEPGTLVYAWFRHHDDPNRIVVLEVYDDADAQKAHLRGPLMRVASAPMGALIQPGGEPRPLVPIAAKGLRTDKGANDG